MDINETYQSNLPEQPTAYEAYSAALEDLEKSRRSREEAADSLLSARQLVKDALAEYEKANKDFILASGNFSRADKNRTKALTA